MSCFMHSRATTPVAENVFSHRPKTEIPPTASRPLPASHAASHSYTHASDTMWSTIGLATARRARVVGGAALSVDKLVRLASRVPSQLRSPVAAAGSLVQRRCFAAAKTDATTTKKATKKPKASAAKPKKKAAAAAKKPAAKKKVALTPEQKKRRDVLKDRKTALLAAEPAKLPGTPRAVFSSEYIKSARKHEEPWTRALAGETFSGAAQAFKDISAYDLEVSPPALPWSVCPSPTVLEC